MTSLENTNTKLTILAFLVLSSQQTTSSKRHQTQTTNPNNITIFSIIYTDLVPSPRTNIETLYLTVKDQLFETIKHHIILVQNEHIPYLTPVTVMQHNNK